MERTRKHVQSKEKGIGGTDVTTLIIERRPRKKKKGARAAFKASVTFRFTPVGGPHLM